MNHDAIVRCRSCGAKNRVKLDLLASLPSCGRCKSRLSVPDRALNVSEGEFLEEVLRETIPTAVDFWAPWCGPCKMVSPVLEDIADKHPGKIKVVKVNSDENPGLSQRFGIQGIPTIILFRDGKEVDRLVGAAPRDNIVRFLRI
jgi:thioredoxin 2